MPRLVPKSWSWVLISKRMFAMPFIARSDGASSGIMGRWTSMTSHKLLNRIGIMAVPHDALFPPIRRMQGPFPGLSAGRSPNSRQKAVYCRFDIKERLFRR